MALQSSVFELSIKKSIDITIDFFFQFNEFVYAICLVFRHFTNYRQSFEQRKIVAVETKHNGQTTFNVAHNFYKRLSRKRIISKVIRALSTFLHFV
jgi:hypothetical protein